MDFGWHVPIFVKSFVNSSLLFKPIAKFIVSGLCGIQSIECTENVIFKIFNVKNVANANHYSVDVFQQIDFLFKNL